MEVIIADEFSVPGESLRRMPNPVEQGIDSDVQVYEFYLQVKHIHKFANLPMDTNPREQHLGSSVSQDIRNSVRSPNHSLFHILNKGITVSVFKVNYDNRTGMVTFYLDDPKYHGNIDGGHTLKILLNEMDHEHAKEKFVKVELITGLNKNNFVEVTHARNTAAKVEQFTIAELEDKFDIIKEGLNNESFLERVTFKQFEEKVNKDKNIPVRHITGMLNLFNIDKYDNTTHPTTTYTGVGNTINYYLDNYNHCKNASENPYYKMIPVMSDFFKIHSLIESNFKEYYNEYGGEGKKRANYLNLSFASSDDKTLHRVKYSNEDEYISYDVPDGLIYPIVASFRALLAERNGKYYWVVNPYNFMNSVIDKLFNLTGEKLRSIANNPSAVGKDFSHWFTLYMVVEHELMKYQMQLK
ncbi:hypothetical protein LCL89_00705 [Halobacillus yeomjeoni]|uniref:hypothetical protein n=1 Tax=Halobacillus yeomjeoni TaxID=311194 RepID=UPI001CD4785E|nr:hypothetical protein [Halobacillus yeomjeoni]MCA0982560.1 hypothetical protein [Halobacillus yeomjeoni]